jgi:hypothetical protein
MVLQLVATRRDYTSQRRAREVVHVDRARVLTRELSSALHVATQRFRLRINAEARAAGCGKRLLRRGHGLELDSTLGMLRPRVWFLGLAGQRRSMRLQQPADSRCAHGMPHMREALTQRAHTTAHPRPCTKRIAGRFRPDDLQPWGCDEGAFVQPVGSPRRVNATAPSDTRRATPRVPVALAGSLADPAR